MVFHPNSKGENFRTSGGGVPLTQMAALASSGCTGMRSGPRLYIENCVGKWRAKQDKDGHCDYWEISRERMK
jgi:hypothetical protein